MPPDAADVLINMIRDAAPFSLGFFRQIIRNDLDEPGTLRQMRLWHHDQPGIMDRFIRSSTCHAPDFTEIERHHSAILYARSPGNADLDWDQPTTLTVDTGGPPPIVTCGR
jgi:hypothetical protein